MAKLRKRKTRRNGGGRGWESSEDVDLGDEDGKEDGIVRGGAREKDQSETRAQEPP